LWDWSQVEDGNARLENIVASHLLKYVHYLQDAEGHKAELSFLRDVDGREVDFLVTIDRKPYFAVEVKKSDNALSKQLIYFKKKLDIPYVYQIVQECDQDVVRNYVRLMGAAQFLTGLV